MHMQVHMRVQLRVRLQTILGTLSTKKFVAWEKNGLPNSGFSIKAQKKSRKNCSNVLMAFFGNNCQLQWKTSCCIHNKVSSFCEHKKVKWSKKAYLLPWNSNNSKIWLKRTAWEWPNLFAKPEAVFLVMLGTSSLPTRHEVYGRTTESLVLSWERARTQHD